MTGLLHDLADGRKRKVTEDLCEYYLGVQPSVAMRFRWNGERWDFGSAEGADCVFDFKTEGGKFFAQKTDLMNPRECGCSLDDQIQARGPGR